MFSYYQRSRARDARHVKADGVSGARAQPPCGGRRGIGGVGAQRAADRAGALRARAVRGTCSGARGFHCQRVVSCYDSG